MPLGCNAGRLVVVDVLREGREGREEESVNASCLVLYIYIYVRGSIRTILFTILTVASYA